MNKNEWKVLAEAKEEEIKNKLEDAYIMAMHNKHMQFSVYLWDDGDITILQDIASGNSEYTAKINGQCINIYTFCFANYDIELKSDSYELEEAITEYDYSLSEYQEMAEKAGYDDLLSYVLENDREIYLLAEKMYVEWEINEYEYQIAEEIYSMFLDSFNN